MLKGEGEGEGKKDLALGKLSQVKLGIMEHATQRYSSDGDIHKAGTSVESKQFFFYSYLCVLYLCKLAMYVLFERLFRKAFLCAIGGGKSLSKNRTLRPLMRHCCSFIQIY